VHHNFLAVTVKKGLKLVYIYRSYYKNKLGGPFFLEHPVYCDMLRHVRHVAVAAKTTQRAARHRNATQRNARVWTNLKATQP